MPTTTILDPRSPSPTPGLPRPPHLRALTSIRFFAALHVGLYHLARPFALWGFFAAFIQAGYTGVSFFFILSGFILTYSHAKEYEQHRDSTSRFYFNRFARIYPVYLLFLLPGIAITTFNRHTPTHFLALAACLAMVQSWSSHTVFYFNIPAWTLSCEAFFYLVFPFLVLRLRPRNPRRAVAGIAILWLLALIAPAVNLHFSPAQTWSDALWYGTDPGRFTLAVIRTPIFALPEFLAGILAGWTVVNFPPTARRAAQLATAGVFLLLLALIFANHMPAVFLQNGLLIPLYAAILVGLSQPNTLANLVSNKPLILLGEASYVFYISHEILSAWLNHWFTPYQYIPRALAQLALITLAAILIHLAVERPARRLLLNWRKRTRRGIGMSSI